MRISILCLVFSVILLGTGCNVLNLPAQKPPSQGQQSQQTELAAKQVKVDPEIAAQAKEAALAVDGVEEATTVAMDGTISTAIKVTGFDRFKLKSIRQAVHKNIRALGNEHNVMVTTDKKLFKQLQEIENQVKGAPQEELPKLKKNFEKINKNMHG